MVYPHYLQALNATDAAISLWNFNYVCHNNLLTYRILVLVKFDVIAGFLQEMVGQVKGRAFVVESNGAFIASTTGTRAFLARDGG